MKGLCGFRDQNPGSLLPKTTIKPPPKYVSSLLKYQSKCFDYKTYSIIYSMPRTHQMVRFGFSCFLLLKEAHVAQTLSYLVPSLVWEDRKKLLTKPESNPGLLHWSNRFILNAAASQTLNGYRFFICAPSKICLGSWWSIQILDNLL